MRSPPGTAAPATAPGRVPGSAPRRRTPCARGRGTSPRSPPGARDRARRSTAQRVARSRDRDAGLGAVDRLHALRDAHGLLDQGLDDLRLRNGLDDLTLDE